MNQQLTFTKPATVQDYFNGWDKAQREYQRQIEKKNRKMVGLPAQKVRLGVSLAFLFLFLNIQFTVVAQSLTQTIRGKVIDRESQAPLIGVSVAIVTADPVKG